MSDLISRQAAIEAIGQNQKIDTKEYTDGYIDGRYDAINAIKELPSSNTHNALEALEMRWIPCSERLPEHMQKVLISTKTGRVHQARYNGGENIHQWYSFVDRAIFWNYDVTAWQPLPEPYKEGEE